MSPTFTCTRTHTHTHVHTYTQHECMCLWEEKGCSVATILSCPCLSYHLLLCMSTSLLSTVLSGQAENQAVITWDDSWTCHCFLFLSCSEQRHVAGYSAGWLTPLHHSCWHTMATDSNLTVFHLLPETKWTLKNIKIWQNGETNKCLSICSSSLPIPLINCFHFGAWEIRCTAKVGVTLHDWQS